MATPLPFFENYPFRFNWLERQYGNAVAVSLETPDAGSGDVPAQS
jgi:hypothetical protein